MHVFETENLEEMLELRGEVVNDNHAFCCSNTTEKAM